MARDIDPLEAFPPRWINKDNVEALCGDRRLTVKSLDYEEIGETKDEKLVMRFGEIAQGFVVKAAHFNVLMAASGSRTSAWIGCTVQLGKNPAYGKKGETGCVLIPVAAASDTVQEAPPMALDASAFPRRRPA
jgi:hypothetical protein